MKTPNYFKVILVVFLVSLLLYALFLVFNNKAKVEKFQDSSAAAGGPEPNSSKVILYYADWCGHCQEYKKSGVFEKVAQDVKNSPIGSKVVFDQRDGDAHESEMSKYDIRGFPSIIAVDSNGNKIEEFTGDRFNEDELIAFAKKSVGSA